MIKNSNKHKVSHSNHEESRSHFPIKGFYNSQRLFRLLFLIIVLVVLLKFPLAAFADSSVMKRSTKPTGQIRSLNKEKVKLQRRIESIEKILKQINKKHTFTVSNLNAINEQINSNKRLIHLMTKERRHLNSSLKNNEKIIYGLEHKLHKLKNDYSLLVYEGMKTINKLDKVLFVFSSSSFNDMFLRLKYITQYSKYRVDHLKKIKYTSTNLKFKKGCADLKKKKMDMILVQEKHQSEKLKNVKVKQERMVTSLLKERNNIRKELKQEIASMNQLKKMIMKVMEQEKKVSKKQVKSTSKNRYIPQEKYPAYLVRKFKEFPLRKGKLKWPVSDGFISKRFGVRRHAILKNVSVENLGIDIRTKKESKVTVVFDGVVKQVFYVPGMHTGVLVKHGDYYTVYIKLKSTNVKVGQILKEGQEIGKVYHNQTTGISELQFHVWKNNYKLNPVRWLKKK